MANQKTGDEHFTLGGSARDFSLTDFWRWQASDLLNNTLRGALAEFIVAKALEIDTSGIREDWEPFDLLFEDGWRVEVKASAYVQSWNPKGIESEIRFGVPQTRAWEPKSGYSDSSSRNSDMYVFCLLAEKDKAKANPLELSQWEFYPALTSEIDAGLQSQKSAGLDTIRRFCPKPYGYESLRDGVLWLKSGRSDVRALARIEASDALGRAGKN